MCAIIRVTTCKVQILVHPTFILAHGCTRCVELSPGSKFPRSIRGVSITAGSLKKTQSGSRRATRLSLGEDARCEFLYKATGDCNLGALPRLPNIFYNYTPMSKKIIPTVYFTPVGLTDKAVTIMKMNWPKRFYTPHPEWTRAERRQASRPVHSNNKADALGRKWHVVHS